jgi:lysophospholipase L1-like esterase
MDKVIGYSGAFFNNLHSADFNTRKGAKVKELGTLASKLYGSVGKNNIACEIVYRFLQHLASIDYKQLNLYALQTELTNWGIDCSFSKSNNILENGMPITISEVVLLSSNPLFSWFFVKSVIDTIGIQPAAFSSILRKADKFLSIYDQPLRELEDFKIAFRKLWEQQDLIGKASLDLFEKCWAKLSTSIEVFLYLKQCAQQQDRSCEQIMLLGDSITAGFGIKERNNRWSNMLQNRLISDGHMVTTVATVGNRVEKVLFSLDNYLELFKPTTVFVLLGGNHAINNCDFSPFTMLDDCKKIITKVREHGAKILWGVGLPKTFECDQGIRSQYYKLFKELEKEGLFLCYLEESMLAEKFMQLDRLHFNEGNQEAISNFAYKHLLKFLQGSKQELSPR